MIQSISLTIFTKYSKTICLIQQYFIFLSRVCFLNAINMHCFLRLKETQVDKTLGLHFGKKERGHILKSSNWPPLTLPFSWLAYPPLFTISSPVLFLLLGSLSQGARTIFEGVQKVKYIRFPGIFFPVQGVHLNTRSGGSLEHPQHSVAPPLVLTKFDVFQDSCIHR